MTVNSIQTERDVCNFFVCLHIIHFFDEQRLKRIKVEKIYP